MRTHRHAVAYAAWGALVGAVFPAVGAALAAASRPGPGLGAAGLVEAVRGTPLLWIICTAPLFLGALAAWAGRRQDELLALEEARREGFLKAAAELFTAAQSLLSTVSSFSSMTAGTAASVRETTATMGQLGHTATQAALTAESVIGLARQGDRAGTEGLSAVEACRDELRRGADEVRGLAQRMGALDGRMHDAFEAAAAMGASEPAARVTAGLAEVRDGMRAALTAADGGLRRIEQAADVAARAGQAIQLLAGALRSASTAAQEIAAVAQQQDRGIDQVLHSMNAIYLATQESMASTQAVATEAKALNDLASGLKRAVER